MFTKLPLIGSGSVPKIFEETPPGGARTFEVGLAMLSICCGVFDDISLKIFQKFTELGNFGIIR